MASMARVGVTYDWHASFYRPMVRWNTRVMMLVVVTSSVGLTVSVCLLA